MVDATDLLADAIEAQRQRLKGYERESEALTLETLRCIDHIFCRELFPEARDAGDIAADERAIMSFGVNHALQRVLPKSLHPGPFRLFPSTRDTMAKTDGFLFDCGILALAERQLSFLREGLLSGEVVKMRRPFVALEQERILVLRATTPSAYAESVGHRGQRWLSEEITNEDRDVEAELERRHVDLLPAISASVSADRNHFMTYRRSGAIDAHFSAWADLYLRRMPHQDMIGPTELIGGRPFGDYLALLRALSAKSQMHLCFAGLHKHRYPKMTFRNLLTRTEAFEDLLLETAQAIGSDTLETQRLLSHLTLDAWNQDNHLPRADTAWAPVCRTSRDFCILPAFGMDINPFLFLLNELRTRYSEDWFRLANERERRWIEELEGMFPKERWASHTNNLKLKRGKQTVTDIDYALQDRQSGDIALFQLKWQQPAMLDTSIRRNNASSLLSQCNAWIEGVRGWLNEYGAPELAKRLSFSERRPPRVLLFVLARYGAHFMGSGSRDASALWSDWAHFRKVQRADPSDSLAGLSDRLSTEIANAQRSISAESLAIPLPGLAVIVNPTREPPA